MIDDHESCHHRLPHFLQDEALSNIQHDRNIGECVDVSR